ncbi:MAG: L-lactate permease, partial [Eggerthellales bacterium]|nr:L-lactate permease [Eggerthellales bacterium]
MLELAPNFILAILPILWLLIALAALKMAAHKAMAITFAIAFVEAVVYWQLPAICALTASVEGVLNALWPICLVIIAALFIYNVTVRTGAMETIKSILVSVSSDQRILALL